MKNCDNLFVTGQTEYENIHKMCSDAYTKGRMAERALAIEAYRLRLSLIHISEPTRPY